MRKIVLVMDNVIIAMMIRNNLVNNGYLVPFITNTLKEALDTDYEMELIIFDMDFISMDRLDEVRVPIIFLTSQSEWEISQEETSTLEVTYDFLCKPFTEEELLYKTRKILPPN
ncbi:MAG TPA: response regulator [Methanobacterium sp.]|nr:MAG: response regulator [Methanobacterium sp.]HOI71045.1 response regulator [Methanobacterium sp.]